MTTHFHDPRTWVEIDTDAIKNNYRELNSLLDDSTQLGSVVKSNAYGHGIVQFAKLLEQLGADWLIVDGLHEGVQLRNEGVKTPILALGFTPSDYFETASAHDVSITISNFESINDLKNKKPEGLNVHLKVNTGMNRQGIFPDEAGKAINDLLSIENLNLEGVYTHLADATTPGSEETLKQLGRFQSVLDLINEKKLEVMRHAGATSGVVEFPQSKLDLARFGIGMYGLWPSEDLKQKHSGDIKLKPGLKWKAKLSEVKNLKKGEKIGYGFTEKLGRDSQVAICPVGYWHGYPIHLSRKGRVLIRGEEAKVLGRVTMDMIILDVSDVENPKPGDEVILLGDKLHPDKVSEEAGTINYEVMTRINPLIKRIYK